MLQSPAQARACRCFETRTARPCAPWRCLCGRTARKDAGDHGKRRYHPRISGYRRAPARGRWLCHALPAHGGPPARASPPARPAAAYARHALHTRPAQPVRCSAITTARSRFTARTGSAGSTRSYGSPARLYPVCRAGVGSAAGATAARAVPAADRLWLSSGIPYPLIHAGALLTAAAVAGRAAELAEPRPRQPASPGLPRAVRRGRSAVAMG